MNEAPEGYEVLGWYAPPEAKRLLEALDEQGIGVHAEFQNEMGRVEPVEAAMGGFGAGSRVLIAAESARRLEVDRIHSRLFGLGLPTFSEDEAGADEWLDRDGGDEVALLEEREGMMRRLDEVEHELRILLAEVAAVDEELQAGGQERARMDALGAAQVRNKARGNELLQLRGTLTGELGRIERLLRGGADH